VSSRPAGGGPIPHAPVPEGVTIRPARPGDAKAWLEHLREVAGERRFIRTEVVRWTARDLRRRFRHSWTVEGASLVAVGEGRVVGTLGLEREGNPVLRHIAALGMAVDRDRRSRGLGSALLAEAFRWAEWAGVEKLSLTVYPHNQRAINLYKKFGFVEEGRLIGHSKKSYGYEDEIVMGRWL
jgi:ribosomal protein S18 acetylase RimI-like enzyme